MVYYEMEEEKHFEDKKMNIQQIFIQAVQEVKSKGSR
jgi:hypothetical protein